MNTATLHFAPLYPMLAALILFVVAVDVGAQELEHGSRIRVHQDGVDSMEGVLTHLTTDSLWLLPRSGNRPGVVPLDSIKRLDVYGRMSRRGAAWRWAKRTFVAGAALGGITCLASPDDCKSSPEESTLEAAAGSAVFLGSGLALIGAVGGAVIPVHRWRRISPPYELTLALSPRGPRIKATIDL